MTEVVAIVDALPLSIRLGWAVWLGWAGAQVVWYRRAYVVARAVPSSPRPAVARPRPRTTLPTIDLSSLPEQPPRDGKPAGTHETMRVETTSILGLNLR